MSRQVRAHIGPCLCEHANHDLQGWAWTGHPGHAYGARRLLTHHVAPIGSDVCAPCAAGIRRVFPDEVTPL